MSAAVELLLAAAAVVGAAAGLWRALRLGQLLRGTRAFLEDWQGEPARPGRERRPSVPERLANVETHLDDTGGQMSGLAAGLVRLQERADLNRDGIAENRTALQRLDDRLGSLDARVTEHRRRNGEQLAELRVEVERRLTTLTTDLTRAEAYRAALVELGLDVTPPD